MTKQDLKEALATTYYQYELNKKNLYKKYALANNPYKTGDIITDHIGSVKIETIGVYVTNGEAECTYSGIQLNKDGNPAKQQKHTQIYQSNIIITS